MDISATAQYRAKTRRYMKTDELKALARLRNGVETIPSILRSQYQVDRMSVAIYFPKWLGTLCAKFIVSQMIY